MSSNLPYELESEILSRVPATSLSKLRPTCKRWYSLFKDLRFVKENLSKAKAATQVILKKNHKVYSVNVNPHGFHNPFDPSIEFSCTLKSLKEPEHVMIYEIFHCDGLLLCTTKNYRVVVWNPCSTGQTRWIQTKKLPKKAIHQKYFLGYENSNTACQSYKILSYSYYHNEHKLPVAKFEIYEFSSNSWRVVKRNGGIFSPVVSLKGNIYCFHYDNKEDLNFLLKFDFTTERFERLSPPFQGDDCDDVVLSVVREQKLALLSRTVDDGKMKIWVTNTMIDEAKDLSWSEFLVMDFRELPINCIDNAMSFLVDEENKMVVFCDTEAEDEDRTLIYIFGDGEDMRKQVYRDFTNESGDRSPLLFSYVPSLVQIQTSHTSNNPGGKRKR